MFGAHDPQLNIRREHYPLKLPEFRQEAAVQVQRAARSMGLIDTALGMLNDIREDRATEASLRWRAAYDLADAQLHIFKLRLYQFLLAMDNHANQMPKPKNPKSNEWNFHRNRKKITPDDAQYGRLKTAFGLQMERDEYLAAQQEGEKKANKLLDDVIQAHPGTPWARRAQEEKRMGIGFVVSDRLWDPSGVRRTIKVPKL